MNNIEEAQMPNSMDQDQLLEQMNLWVDEENVPDNLTGIESALRFSNWLLKKQAAKFKEYGLLHKTTCAKSAAIEATCDCGLVELVDRI